MIKYLLVLLLLTIPLVMFSQNPCPGTPTVNYFGKIYNTVQIGNQCWLKENLDVGIMIQVNQEQTNNGTLEKYCYENNPSNCVMYGGLYQWAEAVQYKNGATNTSSPEPAFSGHVQGICPTGWHIPTDAEFQTLEASVNFDGNALKREDQGTGSGVGKNTSGFSALLPGCRHGNGYFVNFGLFTYFWSSTEYVSNIAWFMTLNHLNNSCYVTYEHKNPGFSIRCLKDDSGTNVKETPDLTPNGFLLLQNYPNPFNPGTVIQFSIPNEVYVTLSVFNTLGEQVTELVNQQLSPSTYSVNFDAKDLPNGIYFYKIQAGEFVQTKKMILMK